MNGPASWFSATRGRHRLRGAVAFLLVLGALGLVLTRAETARSRGAEVVLETQPIDPRDVFFGHYAILSYAIEDFGRRGDDSVHRRIAVGDGVVVALPRAFDRALSDDRIRTAVEAAQAALTAEEDAEAREHGAKSKRGGGGASPRFVDLGDVFVALAPVGPLFHAPVAISADRAAAAAAGDAVLKARATVSAGGWWFAADRDNNESVWRVSLEFDLPDRYYADRETALALEALAAEAGRVQRLRDQWAECRDFASNPAPEADAPWFCADLDPADAEAAFADEPPTFGVVLAVSADGAAVIKGVSIDGRTTYDTLAGPRLALSRDPG